MIQIKRFDPRTIKDGAICLMVAKRGSGKSVLAKDIMYYKRNIPWGVVMSGTEDGNSFYSGFVPDIFVYSDFDRPALERLVNRQRKLVKQGIADPCFVIMDDLAFDKKFLNDKLIRQLFMNGRHWNVFVLFCVQYLMDIPPSLRAQIDYVFTLKENLYREKLWKNFFRMFPSFDMFNAVMDEVTQDFGCLVLDNTGNSSKVSDVVYHYKARFDRKYRLGSPASWGYSKQNFDDRYEERMHQDNASSSLQSVKKKPVLTVKKLK
jgi:hypothetical protein